jgi:hypothetical protein
MTQLTSSGPAAQQFDRGVGDEPDGQAVADVEAERDGDDDEERGNGLAVVVPVDAEDRPCIIIAPTITSAGAVMTLYEPTIAMMGEKNSAARKPMATTTAVSPVRPPCSTPAADSM